MKIEVANENRLPEAARLLAGVVRERRGVVAIYGGMGAGKTTLIRALMEALGSEDTVTSPTFALVNEYMTGEGERVFHFDFYRIDDRREAFDLGYEEYFYGGGLCLVEWPEKIEELLPDDTLRIRIEVRPGDSRLITVE